MDMFKRIFALVLTLGFAASALAIEEGDPAPDFTLPDILAGKPGFTLSDMRGKVVYLDFWASWCAPCLISLPQYNELYLKYRDQGLEIVGINVDDPAEDGQDFLLDTPLDFKIPADPDGDVPELYEIVGMPTSYLIDKNGDIRLVHIGFRNGDIEKIETEIQILLAE